MFDVCLNNTASCVVKVVESKSRIDIVLLLPVMLYVC